MRVLTDHIAEHGEITDEPDDIASAATAVWGAIGVDTSVKLDVRQVVGEAVNLQGQLNAAMTDAQYRAQIDVITQTLELVERALQAEGMPASIRLRVLRGVLVGGTESNFEALSIVASRIQAGEL